MIDAEVRTFIEGKYERAKELLKQYKKELVLLAEGLLEKEVLLKSDLVRMIGERPSDVKETVNGTVTKSTDATEEV